MDLITLGLLAAAGYAALGEHEVVNPSNFRNPFNNATNLWPLANYVTMGGQVYQPVISSPWGTPRSDALDKGKTRSHAGVDVMYRRRTLADQTERWPPGQANGSKWHFIPEPYSPGYKKTPVYAIADAIVWSSGDSARGWQIVLDHGKPWATYYQHLVDSTIPPTSGGRGGRRVLQGDIIGFVSGNPVQKPALKHLHFEVWKGGDGRSAVDPEPLMTQWLFHLRH